MKKKPANLKVYILLIVIAVFIGVYVILNNRITTTYVPDYNLEDFYIIPEEKVGVNEYRVSTVTEEEMINTYFNIYINMLFENPNRAYDELNDEYRSERFASIDDFNSYIAEITNNYSTIPSIDKYSKKSLENDSVIYTILDTQGNKYIFDVEAVMVYEVYLDEDTVEIE